MRAHFGLSTIVMLAITFHSSVAAWMPPSVGDLGTMPSRAAVAAQRPARVAQQQIRSVLAGDGGQTMPDLPEILGAFADVARSSFERMTDLRVARASHILIKEQCGSDEAAVAQLEDVKATVGDDPEKFADAARELSRCPSRVKGGDLGYFTRGKMVREFEAVVFNEVPGAVYGPVRTQYGHHLIYLHSCRTP